MCSIESRCVQYCDIRVVNEVVLPLLSMSSSVLLCISTLRQTDNHYSRMFQMRQADGSPVFETIQISLVCDNCLKSDAPEQCTHKQSEMPRWLSSTKMETIKALLSEDPALFLRESMGISAESTQRAFKDSSVNEIFASPRKDPSFCEYVFIGVDPSGGGTSATAVCSLAMKSNGEYIVRCLNVVLRHMLESFLI